MPAARPHPIRALAAACVLVLAGCTSLAGLDRPPRVTLVNVEPVEIGLLEQRYLLTIRIQNPNPVDLPIDGLEYTVRLNDSQFADGVSSQRVTVPAYGEKVLGVGVSSNLIRLFEQLRRLSEGDGAVSYGISGTLGVTGVPGGIHFDQDGTIDLRPSPAPRGRTT